MKKIITTYNKIMASIGVIFLIGFIISVLVQVFSRTFLPKTPAWTEEAARYLFAYMVAFGCSVAVHKKEFVGIDMLTSHFPAFAKKILNILIYVILLVFCAYVFKRSVLKFAILKFRMVSTAMQIPMQYVYYSMLVLFGLLVVSYLLEIIYVITKDEDESEKTEGGI